MSFKDKKVNKFEALRMKNARDINRTSSYDHQSLKCPTRKKKKR